MAGVAFVTDSLSISQTIQVLHSLPADQSISNPPVSDEIDPNPEKGW